MKICILATSFPRRRDDYVGQWVWGLARALVQVGAQVRVVVPHDRDTESQEVWEEVAIHRFSYWWPRRAHGLCYGAGIPTNIRQRRGLALQFPTLETAFWAAALRWGGDADVINAHWTFAALPAVAACRLLGKPLVTTAYSAEYVPRVLHPLNRFIVNNSLAVISISKFTRDTVEKVVQPRVHRVIGLGVNAEKVAPPDFDPVAFRAANGVGEGQKLVFAVGRLVERKGYHVLVDAATQLLRSTKSYRFILAGQGPEYDALRAGLDAAGITDCFKLIGFVPDDQLRLYLKSADVLVMPSIMDQSGDTEGLGMPLVEAMANETPVVASAIGGILDIVKHEETGLLVPPGDAGALAGAIRRLFADPHLSRHLVEEGKRLVETTFSWRVIAGQTLEVYQQAIEGHRPRPVQPV